MRKYIAVLSVLALLIGADVAQGANGGKALKGFYLGESRAKIEYKLGTGRVGDHFTACITELCNKMAFYEFVSYPSEGVILQYRDSRVIVIDTGLSKEGTYRGISIGDTIPLGKCHRMQDPNVFDAKVINPCVHLYKGMHYDPNGFVWWGRSKGVLYSFTVDKGKVTNIHLSV